jgi:ABC-type dipeptide transport system, periplasmic component
MERNPNYWNKGLPYLDGIEVYHLLPFSPELGSAILSGRVDYARALDPATARKAAATPGLSTAKFYQSVIHATWMNAKRPPFDDPRLRRAMHLLFDKLVLVDVVKDVAPLMTGGFIYPFSEFATPTDQLAKRLGYQEDSGPAIKEAKSLLAGCRPEQYAITGFSWCGISTITSSSPRPCRRCSRRWAFKPTCGRRSNRFGSVTRRPATTIWPSAPSFQPCLTFRLL